MRYNDFMDNKDERNLTLIESNQVESGLETKNKTVRQTNPIAKKFLEFQNQKLNKFSVKDLFKK